MAFQRNYLSMGMTFSPDGGDTLLVKLFSVTVRHTYYSLSRGFCPDLRIAPTPTSVELMGNFGMALRQERFGFSIFIQRGRLKDLQAYLLANALPGPGGTLEFWERLTFSMQLQNPAFIDITQLPLATKINERNLYASNCQAHLEDGLALLSPGPFLDGAAFTTSSAATSRCACPPARGASSSPISPGAWCCRRQARNRSRSFPPPAAPVPRSGAGRRST